MLRPSSSSAELGLPPQSHHHHHHGISDVRCGRPPFPDPVSWGVRLIPLGSVGLPVHWADVCGGGAGVDPRSEREGQAETTQPGA